MLQRSHMPGLTDSAELVRPSPSGSLLPVTVRQRWDAHTLSHTWPRHGTPPHRDHQRSCALHVLRPASSIPGPPGGRLTASSRGPPWAPNTLDLAERAASQRSAPGSPATAGSPPGRFLDCGLVGSQRITLPSEPIVARLHSTLALAHLTSFAHFHPPSHHRKDTAGGPRQPAANDDSHRSLGTSPAITPTASFTHWPRVDATTCTASG